MTFAAFSPMGMEIKNANEWSQREMLPGLSFECFFFFFLRVLENIEGIFVCVDELNKR